MVLFSSAFRYVKANVLNARVLFKAKAGPFEPSPAQSNSTSAKVAKYVEELQNNLNNYHKTGQFAYTAINKRSLESRKICKFMKNKRIPHNEMQKYSNWNKTFYLKSSHNCVQFLVVKLVFKTNSLNPLHTPPIHPGRHFHHNAVMFTCGRGKRGYIEFFQSIGKRAD